MQSGFDEVFSSGMVAVYAWIPMQVRFWSWLLGFARGFPDVKLRAGSVSSRDRQALGLLTGKDILRAKLRTMNHTDLGST